MAQNYGLGRGLSSLIPQKKINRDADSDSSSSDDLQGVDYVKKDNYIPKREEPKKAVAESFNQGVLEVDINKIAANPYQPRIHFDEEKLKELSDSIKEHGVLQPLVVTRKGDEYELIAGERRLQASKLALLTKIPIIIKDIKDKQKLELAIVENIQRHNLNPIEEARSFQQLMDEFQMSQEEVAQKMGKSRSVVANKIRLLKLPVEALKALKDGIITEGHAKAILSVDWI
ncbi:MAG: ParB-like protein nuclease domain family protein [Candidatus Moranbacteria bacterium GW2011_GWF2_34_56]|nr:MAG: ParB-like protein nuclease domain family protein [Candidatus Moranbacteria bacterium GW2011_GWF2_34_56]